MESTIKTIMLTKENMQRLLPKRSNFSNKGSYGCVVNIAGSFMYPGASYLSSVAALKVGAGRVRLATTTNVIPIVASLTPDITFLDLGESKDYTIPKDSYKYLQTIAEPTVYAIGCGLTQYGGTKDFILSFLKNNRNNQTPIIIDADGVNALSSVTNFMMPLNSIITPHPLELSRLIDVPVEEIQANRVEYAWKACQELDCIVLLKGHDSVIAVPNGQIFINKTGNSALAKAGSGDVLTGMIAGFASQGLNLENAACLAVYLHGVAGEIASKTQTEYGVLATNLINTIPSAIRELLF
ncbi:MAG: NAD(P)H-hydrate dehydratase [Cyanobacteria bacterium SIG30]|nr:NAD(P)H-hydrate dehydratase [Cyanobacteria bacterium SIG30]